MLVFFYVVFVRKFWSKIPEEASESFLPKVVFPKLFRSKVFDFNEFPVRGGRGYFF